MRRKVKKKRNARSGMKILLCCLPVILTVLFIYADSRLRPVVVMVAKYRTQSLVTEAVNDAIIDQLAKTEVTYDKLVNLQKGENGEVSSLSYNALEVNKLKSEITAAVIDATAKIPDTNIYIPIGNITNIDFLQNKGPRIKFTINPSTYVEADIESDFQNTGINQVNHQIFIVLKISSSALIPNYSTNVEIENKVCVAQTIIIGKVPNNIGNSVIYPSTQTPSAQTES